MLVEGPNRCHLDCTIKTLDNGGQKGQIMYCHYIEIILLHVQFDKQTSKSNLLHLKSNYLISISHLQLYNWLLHLFFFFFHFVYAYNLLRYKQGRIYLPFQEDNFELISPPLQSVQKFLTLPVASHLLIVEKFEK